MNKDLKLTDFEIKNVLSKAQNQKYAQYLLKHFSNKDTYRLCELGGFLIRDVNFDLDSTSYKQELYKQIKLFPNECEEIHSFVLKYISKHNENMYFSIKFHSLMPRSKEFY